MKNAEMKVVRFSAEDVIATSGLTLSGFCNGANNDLKVNGVSILETKYKDATFYTGYTNEYGFDYYSTFSDGVNLNNNDEVPYNASFNGVYEYRSYSGETGVEGYTYEDLDMGSGWYWIHQ